MKLLATGVVFGIVFIASTMPAYAYLDPGTGSVILQVILGVFAGVLVAGKIYWAKIKQFFSRKPPNSASSGESSAED
jgi:hypothetical protein